MVENPSHQFVSSVCIACSCLECDIFNLKKSYFVHPLLRMLHITPNVETSTCPKVSFLFNVLSIPFR